MLWNVYRFNYNSTTECIECPDNDAMPLELQRVVLGFRHVIEQDCFDLLRFNYPDAKFIIQRYPQPSLCYNGTKYYWTLRYSK